MAQQVVTLVEYSVPRTGESGRGPWSLHEFKDAGGNKYQTFKDDVANVARGLMNQSVAVTYDVETRNYQDSQGENRTANNNVLKGVQAQQQSIETPAPAAPVAGFQLGAATVVGPAALAAPSSVNGDARQTIINRSAALARAIEAHAAGIAVVKTPEQLGEIADVFVKYIESGSMA